MTIVNNSSIENSSIFNSDICIVGSGMSGQLIASKLKNKKIIIVESGKKAEDENIQKLNDIEQVGIKFRENYQNRVRQIGGSANLWANQLMVLNENNINNRDWVTKNFSWPFSYSEIKSHYEDIIKNIYNNDLKNFIIFNSNQENKRNYFLENELLKSEEFEHNNHFWPSKVEKFDFNSKFTKKLLKFPNKNAFTKNFQLTA